jgi:hypothetical protein
VEILVLRFVHVLAGVLWAGTGVFTSLFLMPSLMEAGPAAGPVMASLQKRKIMVLFPVLAVLTVLSGLRLIWIDSSGFSGPFMHSRGGMTFLRGGAAGLLAFLLGMTVTGPAMGRAAALTERLASAPEAERGALMAQAQALRARGAAAGKLIAVLLLIATAAMGVARYL